MSGAVTHVLEPRQGGRPRPEGRTWFHESARRTSAWRRELEQRTPADSGCQGRWRDLESDIRSVLRRVSQAEDQAARLGLEQVEVQAVMGEYRLARPR